MTTKPIIVTLVAAAVGFASAPQEADAGPVNRAPFSKTHKTAKPARAKTVGMSVGKEWASTRTFSFGKRGALYLPRITGQVMCLE